MKITLLGKLFFLAILLTNSLSSCDVLQNLPVNAGGMGVTQADAAEGIRQALSQGVNTGVGFLNKKDGFFGNEAYKILMPPDAQKVVNTLNQIGLGSLVDKAVLQINRSAEDAVGFASPIFINAIKEMTITDAINIIKGPSNSATNYFKEKTTQQLIAAFTPSIKSSLDKLDATRLYGNVINTYNALPLTSNKLNPDLVSYVAGKTTDALFSKIADEEANIRQNPIARTTDILKKVFGSNL